MRHGSLFSGIGGFDLAAEWMGWENVFHCEWNEFGKRVLNYYWPKAISYDDITKTDFSIHRGNIDILTGGFPCQPYSQAGKRLGKEDERHLFPEMLRAIREIQPSWIVGENVRGLTTWNGGMVFNEVQADLEAEGFEVLPFLLPASGVNAPHERYRIWFIAYSNSNANRNIRKPDREANSLQGKHRAPLCAGELVGTIAGIITDTESNGNRRRLSSMESQNDCEREPEKHGENNLQFRNNGKKRNVTNTSDTGFQGSEKLGSIGTIGKERNKQLAGLLPSTWEIFPTEPPICSRNDGISNELAGITISKHRNESIKAYGNAIVPQVVYQIFKAIQEAKNLNNT